MDLCLKIDYNVPRQPFFFFIFIDFCLYGILVIGYFHVTTVLLFSSVFSSAWICIVLIIAFIGWRIWLVCKYWTCVLNLPLRKVKSKMPCHSLTHWKMAFCHWGLICILNIGLNFWLLKRWKTFRDTAIGISSLWE